MAEKPFDWFIALVCIVFGIIMLVAGVAMGQPCFYICFLNQNEDGSWSVHTTLGGYESERVRPPALQGLPGIDLRGGQRSQLGGHSQGALHEFYAGGEIIDNGLGIVRVRLIGP